DAAGLRDDDAPLRGQRDRGRDQRGLAGARRRVDDREAASAQRVVERRQTRGDREVGRCREEAAQRAGHPCSLPDGTRRPNSTTGPASGRASTVQEMTTTPLTLSFSEQFASALPELATPWQGDDTPDPRLLVLNEEVAAELGMDP